MFEVKYGRFALYNHNDIENRMSKYSTYRM